MWISLGSKGALHAASGYGTAVAGWPKAHIDTLPGRTFRTRRLERRDIEVRVQGWHYDREEIRLTRRVTPALSLGRVQRDTSFTDRRRAGRCRGTRTLAAARRTRGTQSGSGAMGPEENDHAASPPRPLGMSAEAPRFRGHASQGTREGGWRATTAARIVHVSRMHDRSPRPRGDEVEQPAGFAHCRKPSSTSSRGRARSEDVRATRVGWTPKRAGVPAGLSGRNGRCRGA